MPQISQRVSKLFNRNTLPAWALIGWKTVDQAANVDFLIGKWDEGLGEAVYLLRDWGWIPAVAWLFAAGSGRKPWARTEATTAAKAAVSKSEPAMIPSPRPEITSSHVPDGKLQARPVVHRHRVDLVLEGNIATTEPISCTVVDPIGITSSVVVTVRAVTSKLECEYPADFAAPGFVPGIYLVRWETRNRYGPSLHVLAVCSFSVVSTR
jgi:hypothetical protein